MVTLADCRGMMEVAVGGSIQSPSGIWILVLVVTWNRQDGTQAREGDPVVPLRRINPLQFHLLIKDYRLNHCHISLFLEARRSSKPCIRCLRINRVTIIPGPGPAPRAVQLMEETGTSPIYLFIPYLSKHSLLSQSPTNIAPRILLGLLG